MIKTQTVSIVTKHIKIYSDNPIHDAIDRIIDACEGLDDPALTFHNASELVRYSERLHRLASTLAIAESEKYQQKLTDEQTN
jgi:hypothetical protein